MPFDSATFTDLQPSAKSLAAVREFNRKNLELNDFGRRADVVAQRKRLYGHEATALQRSATEAEIAHLALQLDAGAAINPRLWVEHFAVTDLAEVA